MHLQLRAAGYNVVRLHSDRGGEFRGRLDDWCLARGVIRSKTGGVDPQANGRAERSVQEVKARIQRILLGAGMDYLQWPMACRYVHEQERRRWSGRSDKPIPSFGAEVLVKRRFWGRHDPQPTHERVKYIAPDPEGHGHLVLRPEGNAVPYFIGKIKRSPQGLCRHGLEPEGCRADGCVGAGGPR